MTEPIFVISMPRSGSTLLQRLIATHPDVATSSEPWLLLPLLYSTMEQGVHSEYRHRLAVRAIADFSNELPEGSDAYWDEMAHFARRLYGRAAAGAPFFLDKTPRYHLIGERIMKLFPNSPVIVLWRHPLAVVSSIVETWGGGKWNVYDFAVDVERGPANLASLADHPRVIEVDYDRLTAATEEVMEGLFVKLGLDPEAASLTSYRDVSLKGRYGDQTGISKYPKVSIDPRLWPRTFRPVLRRRWAHRYLDRLGSQVMRRMGYSLEESIENLNHERVTLSGLVDDSMRISYGSLHGRINDRLFGVRAGALRPGRGKP